MGTQARAIRLSQALGVVLLLSAACGDAADKQDAGATGSGGSAAPAMTSGASGGTGGNSGGAGSGHPASGTGGASSGSGGGGGMNTPSMSDHDAATGQDAAQGADAAMPGETAVVLTDAQTLIPDASWDCNMPAGIAPTAGATLVFEADLQIGDVLDIGATQYGTRKVIPISGGTFEGPKIKGQFMDGGLDWELTRPNGVIEIEGVAILRTDDGSLIYLRNCGVAPGSSGEVRLAPDFEAPSGGSYAFLNEKTLVGKRELDVSAKTLKYTVYEVDPAAPAVDAVSVPKKDPALPRQTWECEQPKGAAGALVYTEAVGIGGGLAVGQSKYGTRNIIPITGGTFSGQKLNGDVIPGGADFQLTRDGSSDLELDARYTLRADDGELIVVRNCGSAFGSTLYFETRTAGPYAWLNAGDYTSSVALAIGGVMISIYEAQ